MQPSGQINLHNPHPIHSLRKNLGFLFERQEPVLFCSADFAFAANTLNTVVAFLYRVQVLLQDFGFAGKSFFNGLQNRIKTYLTAYLGERS